MEKWECQVCGYIYDPEKGDPDNGVEPGTSFKDIPEDWVISLGLSPARCFRYTTLASFS